MASSERVPSAPTAVVLDLTYLASGVRQHAFVPTGSPDAWVYKIPAAFGYIVPYEHRIGRLGPVGTPRQAVHRLIVGWPHLVRVSLLSPALCRLDTVPGGRLLSMPVRALGNVARAARDRLLAAYYRRARRRNFADMLALLRQLQADGLERVVLPFEILGERAATLRVDDHAVDYRGPILAQRRTDTFFNKATLHPFDWDELVEALHALWRHGYALVEKGENLGYRSWALLDGHPRLADTSSLSRSRERALHALRPDVLDAQERHVIGAQSEPAVAEEFARFFAYLRARVNQEQLATLWRSADALAAPPAGSR